MNQFYMKYHLSLLYHQLKLYRFHQHTLALVHILSDLMFLYLIRFVVNSCHFHGRYEGVHRVLVCITAVDVAQIALNPVFGHAYRAERIVLPDGGIYFELLSGTGHVLHMLLACVYLAVIFIALAVKIFRTPMLYAEKYLIIFGAILLTTIWQFVSIFSHWQMDTSMIGYAVCGLIIFYFSLYYKPAFLLQRMMHYIVSVSYTHLTLPTNSRV